MVGGARRSRLCFSSFLPSPQRVTAPGWLGATRAAKAPLGSSAVAQVHRLQVGGLLQRQALVTDLPLPGAHYPQSGHLPASWVPGRERPGASGSKALVGI